MALALAVDAAIGWPDALYRRIGHPVTWIGALITLMEQALNQGEPARRRLMGSLTTLTVTGLAALAAALAAHLLPPGLPGVILGAFLAWPLIAARSLYDHVNRVARPLLAGDLAAARRAVSMIVGRDPERLDDSGVARAALESLGENASDGVIAPLFWGLVLGLPGLAAYKAINTLDSMIGHRSARYVDFGRSAARLDDLVNLLPARLTGLLIALVSPRPGQAVRVMARDARHHRSPNAGWPEAALAAALGIRLSGPRVYDTGPTEEPWLNDGAPDASPADLRRGLSLYLRMMAAAGGVLILLAALP